MGKQRKSTELDEGKHIKFLRIVEPRVNRAIRALELVGNCSVKSYAYTPEEIEQIHSTLRGAIETAMTRFYNKGGTTKGFKFGE